MPTRKPQEGKKKVDGKARSIKQLKADLWRLFSKFIRERDKYTCYTCGKPGNEAGHFYHSKGYLIHFEERAVHTQCPQCNRWKSGNLQEYARRLVRDYGPGILEEFNDLKNIAYKPTREEYEKRIEHLKAALSNQLEKPAFDDLDKILEECGL